MRNCATILSVQPKVQRPYLEIVSRFSFSRNHPFCQENRDTPLKNRATIMSFQHHKFEGNLQHALCFFGWCLKIECYICVFVQTACVKSAGRILFRLVKLCYNFSLCCQFPIQFSVCVNFVLLLYL